MANHEKTITLAMTGASGAQYGLRLLECLLAANCKIYLLLSQAAEIVIRMETGLALPETLSEQKKFFLARHSQTQADQLQLLGHQDWLAPVASGSSAPDAMVVCPCSGGTLSAIATGASNNLIERGADVCLKERRQLILLSREMPYSQIHLQHMLTLTQMGAIVMPASPGFYHQPKTIDDLVDFVVSRILDQLNIDQDIMPRWGAEP